MDKFLTDYPELPLLLKSDSELAKPEVYNQRETNAMSYVICLKGNNILRALTFNIEDCLIETTKKESKNA